jgi:hypothetical protein
MDKKKEICYIEFTIRKIFEKNKISRYDVAIANRLLYKWKKLTEHKERNEYPIADDIIDREPT